MIPSTVDRVPRQTSYPVNCQISEQTRDNIAHYARLGREAIDRRLEELEQEWDIERTLEANAAIATMTGVLLGLTVNRKFLLFPAVIGGFLLQHAVQGWCPPLPVFRRLGVRTSYEIDEERYALKTIRGDFANLTTTTNPAAHHPDAVIAAVRK